MKIAFTYNPALSDAEEEAEFDSPGTVDAIVGALSRDGHEVQKIEVSGPRFAPRGAAGSLFSDLIFNGEGTTRSRPREAFIPHCLKNWLSVHRIGCALSLTVTLDKWRLTKRVLGFARN